MKLKTENCFMIFVCYMRIFHNSLCNGEKMKIIENFLALADGNNDIEKRNSIVDGGVFVPYKSTTIVYKSRLVPVTYGFVINKETLKDNPALHKLGVQLMDDKSIDDKAIKIDGKNVESVPSVQSKLHDQNLHAKSNCVKSSKVLRLLKKLSEDIRTIEETIQAESEKGSHQGKISMDDSLNKISKKPEAEHEKHISGEKEIFEKHLKSKDGSTTGLDLMKRYHECRQSHTRKQCSGYLHVKHRHKKLLKKARKHKIYKNHKRKHSTKANHIQRKYPKSKIRHVSKKRKHIQY